MAPRANGYCGADVADVGVTMLDSMPRDDGTIFYRRPFPFGLVAAVASSKICLVKWLALCGCNPCPGSVWIAQVGDQSPSPVNKL